MACASGSSVDRGDVHAMKAHVPRRLDDITPVWATAALGEEIAALAVEDVVHGTATKVLLRFDYATDRSDLPPTLCLKAPLEAHAELMAPSGIYEVEARFFAELRPRLPVRAPRSWWAAVDRGSRMGAVLLEDLRRPDVQFCRVTEAFTVDQAAEAVEMMAGYHGARWEDPALASNGWELSVSRNSPSADYFETMGRDTVAGFLARPERARAVPAELHDPERIIELFWAWVDTTGPGPHTLLHGDAHIGNTYLDGKRPALCDWQTARRGRPAFDLAYFIGSALTIDDRRAAERDLLTTWRRAVAGHGGDPPEPDELWLDYRQHMAYGLFAWLTNLEEFQPEEVIAATVARFAQAVIDVDTERAVRS
jgi:hypothetical protein